MKELIHVTRAKKAMKKAGLENQDWIAAKYLQEENKPHFIAIYPGTDCWFALCYDKANKWMNEDKLAFDTKEIAVKFADVVGAEYEID